MYPPKLKSGSGIRVIGPSCTLPSMPWVNEERVERAKGFFRARGMTVSEGRHLRNMSNMETTSIGERVEDIHDALADPSVHALIAIRGGWNANQLLGYLEYDLFRKYPKILCGFSDITALGNAVYAKTGLVTYSGPNFSHFGFGEQIRYDYDSFEACLLRDGPYRIDPSAQWTNDRVSPEAPDMAFEPNEGPWIIQEGEAEGRLLGGNLCTLNLLQGTEYMPDIRGSILFLEDDHESPARTFDRNLQSLLHQPAARAIRGLVIGRFEKASAVTRELLTHVIETKRELRHVPVIANADFGHTQPLATFPIGGTVKIAAQGHISTIEILGH
jgi:muramoyltetrapeptide carboxypeptidase